MAKFFIILLSIVYMSIVGAVGALPSLFYEYSFKMYISVFFVIIAAQLFIGTISHYFISNRIRLQEKKLEIEEGLAKSLQSINTECAYCKSTNRVSVLIGKEKNQYECVACKQTNSVLVTAASVRVNSPVLPKENEKEIFSTIDK